MSIGTINKAKVSIGPATRCTALAEFKALTGWDEIANVINAGEFSGEKTKVIGRYLDQPFVRKLSGGPRDKGAIQMVFGHDADNEGQIALKAADADGDAYAIKIELNDAPAGGTPTTIYFMAIIGPVNLAFGDGTEEIRLNATFDVDGGDFEDPAAPA